jgi:hypothetical protein
MTSTMGMFPRRFWHDQGLEKGTMMVHIFLSSIF